MAKKIKASKFYVSKICERAEEEAEEQALLEMLKREGEKNRREIVEFEIALVDAILNNLKGVPSEELEKQYGDEILVDFIGRQLESFDYIENTLGIPWDAPEKLPSLYV